MLVPGTRREPRARNGIRMRVLRARVLRVRAELGRRTRPPRPVGRRLLPLRRRVQILGALQLTPQAVHLLL